MSRLVRSIALLALLALVGAACDTGGDAGGGGGGEAPVEITIAIGSEPTTLDPQLRDDGGERAVNDNIYETLLVRTPQGDLQPGLAADLPEQVDDTTWRLTLREGITFTNGEAFNADAVVHSVERIIDPAFESEQAGSFFGTITGAEAVDDLTVDIVTNGPDPVLPSRMYWMKMVPPEASGSADFAENPVGTGPYTFVEWARGDHVTLEANQDYWDGAPAIDRVTFRFVGEAGTRLAGLLSGELDLITNLLPEDTEAVEGAGKQAVAVQGLEHPVIILNVDEGITSDVRVRQALNLAVDKESLANDLFAGNATVDACQILSPSWTGFNEVLQPYPYDPDQASALLEEAGATGATVELIGERGRWLKDGELLEAVAGYWDAVGIDAKLRIFEFDEYLNRLFGEVRPDAVFVTSSNELLDASRNLGAYYHRDGIGASNNDEELTGLLDQALVETDPDQREQLYAQATQIACDDAYFLFLLNINDTYGMSERLSWQPRVDAKLLVKEMAVTA